jgi:DNA-binding CsgD family transcriptional regulator
VRAEQLLREALKLDRVVGMKQGEAACLVALGESALLQGRDSEAQSYLDEGVVLYREIGDRSGVAFALVHLSTLAVRRGDAQLGVTLLKDAFTMFEANKEAHGVAVVLEHLAGACTAIRQYERAAWFLGAAETVRGRIGATPWPIERVRIERDARRIRGQVGSAAFRAAWETGVAMRPDEITVEVLASSAPEQMAASAAGGTGRGPVTRREAEVAALIAAGNTNREIAAALFISERTADNHVLHMLNKLGFTSRSQIAAWAAAQGLVRKKG